MPAWGGGLGSGLLFSLLYVDATWYISVLTKDWGLLHLLFPAPSFQRD